MSILVESENESRVNSTMTNTLQGGALTTLPGDFTESSSIAKIGDTLSGVTMSSGVEYRVNTTIIGNQLNGQVVVLLDGSYVIVWQSQEQDGSDWGIYGQRYDVNGDAIGSETQINTTTAAAQLNPSISSLTDGGYIVTWESEGQDGSGSSGIYGQRYDASGSAVGDEFQINSMTANNQQNAEVQGLPDGGFVVVWQSEGQESISFGVYGQRYDAAGNALGDEFQINTTTQGKQSESAITSLVDGGFVVTWHSWGQDGDGFGVYGQRYDADGNPVANEFQINSTTEGNQQTSSVTGLADGGFVVTWQSKEQDGSGWGIFGQRYDAAGTALGDEFQINSNTEGSQQRSDVTSLADGGFVVTWQSWDYDSSGFGVYGQRFDANGDAVDDEFLINTETSDNQRSSPVRGTEDGGFIVVWQSESQDGSEGGIYSKQYLANTFAPTEPTLSVSEPQVFTASGDEFQVNTYTISDQKEPAITALTGGGFVVTWESLQDGSRFGVYGQRYDSAGNKVGSEFQINTNAESYQGGSSVSALTDGGFVVTWSSRDQDGGSDGTFDLPNNGIYGQRFDSDGNTVGTEFQINTYTEYSQEASDITALADGGFVVTWQSNDQDGSAFGIYGQRYDASGNAIGSEFQINTYTNDTQSNPAITALADGDFVVTWDSFLQDGSGWGIFGQRYDVSGTTVGDEFQINTNTDNSQYHSAVSELAGGGFVVTWASNQDGSYDGVYGQRYDASGNALGNEFQINTYTDSYQSEPSITGLTDGGFVVTWESTGQDGPDFAGIYGQRYDSAGNRVGSEFQINTYIHDTQSNSVITALADGGFVVTWQSLSQDGSMNGIYGQIYKYTTPFEDGEIKLDINAALSTTDGSESLSVIVSGVPTGATLTKGIDNGDGSWTLTEAELDSLFLIPPSDYGGTISLTYTAIATDNTTGQTANTSLNQDIVITAVADAPLLSLSDGVRTGDEFQINTYTEGYQTDSSITALADGGFVVTWQSYLQDGSSYGVYGQRYDSNGDTLGDEFRINTTIESSQSNQAISALVDGGFVVAWTSYEQDGSSSSIYGQRYDANGNAAGSEYLINTTVGYGAYEPSINSLADGGFVVTWTTYGQDGSGEDVFGQRYDADGTAVGSEFQINSYTDSHQHDSAITGLADGGFVVTWYGPGQDSYGIFGQRYNANGEPLGTEFEISPTDNGIYLEAFPDITGLTDGGFVVSWVTYSQEDSGYAVIYGQRYDVSGNPVGGEFQINTYNSGEQTLPAITALGDGGFVVTWQSYQQDGSDDGVFGQRYDANGNTLGSEFQINAYINDEQQHPAISAFVDGSFVVTWESYGQDGSAAGIYGQRFAAPSIENQVVELGINASLTDTDGSETLTVTISDMPEGASLSAGTEVSDGVWDVDGDDLAGLNFIPPTDFVGEINLSVIATATETTNGDTASTEAQTMTLLYQSLDTNNVITGDSGDNSLFAGAGNDILFGGEGNDILVGGLGDDILQGDAGADRFQFNLGDTGTDTITDFDASADILDLSDLLSGTGVTEDATSLDVFLGFNFDGTDTQMDIDVDSDGSVEQSIILKDVDITVGNTLTDVQIINNLLSGTDNLDV